MTVADLLPYDGKQVKILFNDNRPYRVGKLRYFGGRFELLVKQGCICRLHLLNALETIDTVTVVE